MGCQAAIEELPSRCGGLSIIGGVPATVSFSGLAPYWVGLYQINASLPANTPTGSQDLIISIGGATSKATKLPVQ